jgi:hypothetical protein
MLAKKSTANIKRENSNLSEYEMEYGVEEVLMPRMALHKINVQQTQVFRTFYCEKSILSLF